MTDLLLKDNLTKEDILDALLTSDSNKRPRGMGRGQSSQNFQKYPPSNTVYQVLFYAVDCFPSLKAKPLPIGVV